ncbi:DUF3467 domain-containing protein [Candidatus Peregrinibacteria bacterium]|nr:DUF3467 domain-containing protein [Candidatus Peregrinibacteria bacterium]
MASQDGSTGKDQSDQEAVKKQLQIQIDKEMQEGKYSNAVSVNVNSNEVVLDMGYILPNMNPTTIKVVSRINMNHRTAESFMKILQDAMLDWRNKQKK